MIMDSPGRHAGRQQGETMAVGTDGRRRMGGVWEGIGCVWGGGGVKKSKARGGKGGVLLFC